MLFQRLVIKNRLMTTHSTQIALESRERAREYLGNRCFACGKDPPPIRRKIAIKGHRYSRKVIWISSLEFHHLVALNCATSAARHGVLKLKGMTFFMVDMSTKLICCLQA